jgi:hypothetical protein
MTLKKATSLKPRIELKVVRNHNYTISLIDRNGKTLSFRDISGRDLEFLENSFNKDEKTQKNYLTFESIINLLNLLNVEKIDFQNYPKRICFAIFKAINEHILCNYMPKYDWLKNCYALQNGSFTGLAVMEEVPMTKFIAMTQVHKEAIDSINNNPE